MNPFLLSADARLAYWKEFRKSLSNMEETIKFESVAKYWSQCPIKTIAYDASNPSTWPTPWEMINDNEWCRSSIAIGMENMLRLSGFPSERMKLKLIIDRTIQEVLLVLVIDDQWILNYDWGLVKPYPKTNHNVLKSWKFLNKAYVAVY